GLDLTARPGSGDRHLVEQARPQLRDDVGAAPGRKLDRLLLRLEADVVDLDHVIARGEVRDREGPLPVGDHGYGVGLDVDGRSRQDVVGDVGDTAGDHPPRLLGGSIGAHAKNEGQDGAVQQLHESLSIKRCVQSFGDALRQAGKWQRNETTWRRKQGGPATTCGSRRGLAYTRTHWTAARCRSSGRTCDSYR